MHMVSSMNIVFLKSLIAILAIGTCMTIGCAKQIVPGGLFYWGHGGVTPIGDDARRSIPSGGFDAMALENIVDVEATDAQIAVVAVGQDLKHFADFSVFLLRKGRDTSPVEVRVPGIIRASPSPDGKMVALGICNSNGCQLEIVETDPPATPVWMRASTQRITSVEWNPRQPKIAYVTDNDLIHIVNFREEREIEVSGSEMAGHRQEINWPLVERMT